MKVSELFVQLIASVRHNVETGYRATAWDELTKLMRSAGMSGIYRPRVATILARYGNRSKRDLGTWVRYYRMVETVGPSVPHCT